MAQVAKQERHWKDRAIAAAEAISDAFDVAKAYGAHIANWVLFFCLVANLVEMVSPGFEALAGLVIVGVQSISLDIAGFGLTAMAASAKRRGDEKSAKKANFMGWMLISVMAITVGLITVAAFKKEWASEIQQANQVLMFIRVIVTVFYGHIVHQLREESSSHENRLAELETEVSTLQKQIKTKEQEVSTTQGQLSGVQKTVSALQQQLADEKDKASGMQHKLDLAQQKVSSLELELESGQGDTASLHRELNTAKLEAESLRGRLDAKTREVESMQSDQTQVVTMRRDLNTARLAVEDLQAQLNAKTREVKEMESGQAVVITLRRDLGTAQARAEELHSQLGTKQQALKNEQLLVANLRREVEQLQQNEAKNEALRQRGEAKNEADAKVINFSGAFASKKELLAEVYRLADVEKLSTYDIEKRVNKPAKTIQRWLRDRGAAENEAENEATGTDE